MDMQLLIGTTIIGVLVAAVVLVVAFGYRLSDLAYLAAAMLPLVWLNRFNLYSITVGESTIVLLWAAFGLVTAAGLLFGNRRTALAIRAPTRKVGTALAVLIGLMVLSNLANSGDAADAIRGVVAILFVVLPYFAAMAVARWCRFDERSVQRAIFSLCLAGNFLAVLGILTALFPGTFRFIGTEQETFVQTRAYSPLGGANGTGMILLMFYCVAFGQVLANRQRVFSAVTLALCFLGLLTTLARAALLAFILVNLFLLVCQRRGIGQRFIIVSAVGLVLLVPLAYKLGQRYSLQRLDLTPTGLKDAARGGRGQTMWTSLQYGMEHFVLGGGWGLVYDLPRIRYHYRPGSEERTFSLDGRFSLTTPHSLPALVFVESGGLALLALLFFLWRMWTALAPPDPGVCPHGAAVVQGFRASVLGFFLASVFQDNLFLVDKVAYCYYLIFFTGVVATVCYNTVAQGRLVAQTPRVTAPQGLSPVPEV